MEHDIDRILISADDISRRVTELGRAISRDLMELSESGELILVPVLTGSIIFVADLMRHLPQKLRLSVVTVSSYPGRSTASQGPSLSGGLPNDLSGRHVLIIDDILDSGRTIRLLQQEMVIRNPLSVRTCVLIRKKTPIAMNVNCEYVGFDIPDEFVVGYGLDYDDYYRNLPHVGTLKPEAM